MSATCSCETFYVADWARKQAGFVWGVPRGRHTERLPIARATRVVRMDEIDASRDHWLSVTPSECVEAIEAIRTEPRGWGD